MVSLVGGRGTNRRTVALVSREIVPRRHLLLLIGEGVVGNYSLATSTWCSLSVAAASDVGKDKPVGGGLMGAPTYFP